jgi:predicted RNA binding protein YcfA (HicA-like mRNA interferase family)
MGGKLPHLRGRDLIKAPGRAGFSVIRVRGSHHFLRHKDGRATIVPVHAGESIGPGLLIKVLADCDMTRDQLAEFL